MNWRKSSYSLNGGENCVEVGQAVNLVTVRDTNQRDGVALVIDGQAWTRFIKGL